MSQSFISVKKTNNNLLAVTDDGALQRKHYAKLLSRFPASTEKKVGDNQLNTEIGKAHAVVQLTGKHDGEIALPILLRGQALLVRGLIGNSILGSSASSQTSAKEY